MTSRYLWLLDNGHGGVIDGLYQTEGKRSPVWNDGSVLYEGEFNRSIVNRLAEMMTASRIRYVTIAPEYEDVSLNERVRRANSYHSRNECIYVSIHANAGGGKGYEIYTSKGETRSDKVAEVFFEKFKEEFPDVKMRTDYSDGDVDKEANFYVLDETFMPRFSQRTSSWTTRRNARCFSCPAREETASQRRTSLPYSTWRNTASFSEMFCIARTDMGGLDEHPRWAYMNGPSKEQILRERKENMPRDVTFIFGHTHKPFEEDMNFRDYPQWVNVYNTGGWVVETAEPLHGSAVVLVDEN